MKKILILLALLIPSLTFAQYKYYKDSSYTQGFNFLSGGTSVNSNTFWDDPEFAIPIGFTFHLFNDTINTVHISAEVGLGGFLTTETVTPSTTYSSGIIAFGSDIQDRDTSENSSFSPISYTLSGTAPSRIFKLEWKNAGFYNAIDNGIYADSVNFQLWLYEGSDAVEMRFGNGNYVSPLIDLYDGGPGPLVGLFDSLNINTADARMFYFMKNSVTSPTLDSTTNVFSSGLPPGMNGNPVAGSVYRFIPKKGSISTGYTAFNTLVSNEMSYSTERNELRIDIYNNETFQYSIFDMQGHPVSTGSVSKGRKLINTGSLASGMYIVKLSSAKENNTCKFVR